jgi:transcriptional regulator with XRE-family HTH domain
MPNASAIDTCVGQTRSKSVGFMRQVYRYADIRSIGNPNPLGGTLGASMETFGTRVKQMRTIKGLTQKALAAAIRIKQPSLSEIETGETAQPTAQVLMDLAKELECSPGWLLSGKGSPASGGQVTIDESELLEAYRGIDERGRTDLLAYARTLLARHPGRSRANPFPRPVNA